MIKFFSFKLFITGLLILSLSQTGKSQVYSGDKKYLAEASGMVGWLFSFQNSYSKIRNNPVYTVSAAYIRNEQRMYELNVNTMISSMHYRAYNGYADTSARYTQTYLMFGVVKLFTIGHPKFQPFFSTSIGFVMRSVDVVTATSQTQLAIGLQGGIKYFVKDHYGIKAQARLQSSLDGLGLGFGFGTGGPSVGIGSYSNSMQIDLSAGMFYRF